MTKKEMGEIVKRYPYIIRAIKNGKAKATFYIGNRRQQIEITETVRAVCKIIGDIYRTTRNPWIRRLIRGILAGKSDTALICELPWERNAYYERKRKLIEKIYNCCISLRLVKYLEILQEEIA